MNINRKRVSIINWIFLVISIFNSIGIILYVSTNKPGVHCDSNGEYSKIVSEDCKCDITLRNGTEFRDVCRTISSSCFFCENDLGDRTKSFDNNPSTINYLSSVLSKGISILLIFTMIPFYIFLFGVCILIE